MKIVSKHHRKPKSKKGTSDPSNISLVEKVQHQAWHTLFSTLDAEDIADIINGVWLDPAYKLVCVSVEKHQRVLKSLSQLT